MKTKEFPAVSEDVIKALEAIFPNRLPDNPDITIQEVSRLQGKQEVIAYLRIVRERQNKTILEG